MKTIRITFQDPEDAKYFLKWVNMAKEKEGTVGGLYTGLACSAIKRATVKEVKSKTKTI